MVVQGCINRGLGKSSPLGISNCTAARSGNLTVAALKPKMRVLGLLPRGFPSLVPVWHCPFYVDLSGELRASPDWQPPAQ
jgi:hypothetical protein